LTFSLTKNRESFWVSVSHVITDMFRWWPSQSGEFTYSGMVAVPAPRVVPVMLLLLETRWKVKNKERTGLWLQQKEHIRGHLWHRCSVSLNQVMGATWMTSTWSLGTLDFVASLIVATLYQGMIRTISSEISDQVSDNNHRHPVQALYEVVFTTLKQSFHK